jgi:TPP-dependent pyruvate/acetoin dehydrogenase alpha subunit
MAKIKDLITKDEARALLEKMILCREFENAVGKLFREGKFLGWTHLGIGHEAVAVGTISVINPDDYIVITYRGHIHTLAKGSDPKKVLAEILCKKTGINGGFGSSMHLHDMTVYNYGSSAIVGEGAPIAVGIAYYLKYFDKKNRVCLNFFGDGALATGVLHEAMNMAALWKLPVIFICENNQYAELTPMHMHHAVTDLSLRAVPFGIPSKTVDGMDVIEVREAVKEAVKRAREGQGPSLIVANVYRFVGHYEGDPQYYRSKEEIEKWKAKDPIDLFTNRLIEEGYLDIEEINKIKKEVQQKIDEAIDFATRSPDTTLEDLLNVARKVYYL